MSDLMKEKVEKAKQEAKTTMKEGSKTVDDSIKKQAENLKNDKPTPQNADKIEKKVEQSVDNSNMSEKDKGKLKETFHKFFEKIKKFGKLLKETTKTEIESEGKKFYKYLKIATLPANIVSWITMYAFAKKYDNYNGSFLNLPAIIRSIKIIVTDSSKSLVVRTFLYIVIHIWFFSLIGIGYLSTKIIIELVRKFKKQG